MTYSIECRRMNTAGNWFFLGNHRCDLAVAKMVAQDAACEFQRETRVVTYGGRADRGFQVHAEFSALGQPLREVA